MKFIKIFGWYSDSNSKAEYVRADEVTSVSVSAFRVNSRVYRVMIHTHEYTEAQSNGFIFAQVDSLEKAQKAAMVLVDEIAKPDASGKGVLIAYEQPDYCNTSYTDYFTGDVVWVERRIDEIEYMIDTINAEDDGL